MGATLFARADPLASAEEQRRRLGAAAPWVPFVQRMGESAMAPLRAIGVDVLQINVGKFCNQTCRHCHVDAGPERREQMSEETARLCVDVLAKNPIPTVDITGGAPELNANFRWIVEQARALGRRVIDRCNLSVLLLKPQADLAGFLAHHGVEVVASLPHYLASTTDAQRGAGAFARSIEALQLLNRLGYGVEGSSLVLTLVHNPAGAFLPPRQDALEAQYRRQLGRRHGIVFNRLYTITNLPISRFLQFLIESGNYEDYMQTLANSFNPSAASAAMCRRMISVGWDGSLYDCDFNQMLETPLRTGACRHIRDFDLSELQTRQIAMANHCYGCTAGAGSSCGGATT